MAAGCCIERAEVFRQVFLRRTAVAGTGAGGGKGGSAESSPGAADMARCFLVLFSRGGESGLSRLLAVALESSDRRMRLAAMLPAVAEGAAIAERVGWRRVGRVV